jgi:hypothetical protein
MASSFRMMLFPPREAMTTAEPPEPLFFQHSEVIVFKQILLLIGGPAARHIGVHWCLFVVPYQSFWLL